MTLLRRVLHCLAPFSSCSVSAVAHGPGVAAPLPSMFDACSIDSLKHGLSSFRFMALLARGCPAGCCGVLAATMTASSIVLQDEYGALINTLFQEGLERNSSVESCSSHLIQSGSLPAAISLLPPVAPLLLVDNAAIAVAKSLLPSAPSAADERREEQSKNFSSSSE